MATRYLEGARTTLQQQADRLFSLYRTEQLAARGLRASDSLDVETVYDARGPAARVLPIGEARTTAYVAPVVESETVCALELDDWAQAQQGRGGVDVRGSKEFDALDERLRERIRPSAVVAVAPGDSRLGSPRKEGRQP